MKISHSLWPSIAILGVGLAVLTLAGTAVLADTVFYDNRGTPANDAQLSRTTPVVGYADLHVHQFTNEALAGAWLYGHAVGSVDTALARCSGNVPFAEGRNHGALHKPFVVSMLGPLAWPRGACSRRKPWAPTPACTRTAATATARRMSSPDPGCARGTSPATSSARRVALRHPCAIGRVSATRAETSPATESASAPPAISSAAGIARTRVTGSGPHAGAIWRATRSPRTRANRWRTSALSRASGRSAVTGTATARAWGLRATSSVNPRAPRRATGIPTGARSRSTPRTTRTTGRTGTSTTATRRRGRRGTRSPTSRSTRRGSTRRIRTASA